MEVRPGCDLVETRRAVGRAWGQATFGESRASATDETWSVSHTLNIYGVRVWTLCKQGKGSCSRIQWILVEKSGVQVTVLEQWTIKEWNYNC